MPDRTLTLALLASVFCSGLGPARRALAEPVDLTSARIVVRDGQVPLVERTAATVLAEEIGKRTGLAWPVAAGWPETGPVIALTSGSDPQLRGRPVPAGLGRTDPEGFGIATETSPAGCALIWIVGADPKGALSGVGRLLRALEWRQGSVRLARPLNLVTAPRQTIRGHQLGYRTTANSYDAWSAATYDQYIRELALFGANAVENIPFQDQDSPHMPISRREMNRQLGRVCARYGMAYWVWTPATCPLEDATQRAALLAQHEQFYADCPRLDAVFFPGGDPGNNSPEQVMLFLADIAERLAKYHPRAGVWMSLQGFDAGEIDYFFSWITQHEPDWFAGAVGGPSSPPLAVLRQRLPDRYQLRDYPDITHSVRAQYPAPWLDPAFAFTSGREGTNPAPIFYGTIHNATAPYTDGFVTYSDGMHDDVNKTVWSALGWNPRADLRGIIVQYCRLFFGPDVAEQAADGIFALERNWSGPLATNGGVEATLALWQQLDEQTPRLGGNWRWQLCQLKAHYDAYVRQRLIRESEYEVQANAALARAATIGSDAAIAKARAALRQAQTSCNPALQQRVTELCDALFHSIGFQTSVARYGANSAERGAVLDFLDHPLNNRWWLEDELAKVGALATEAEKVARLDLVRTWAHPGPGSYYDDVGNVANSPHVIRGESFNTDPHMRRNPNPDFMWWDGGMSRARQSCISKMDWPIGLRYEGVDPAAHYVVRTTGYGQCLLRVNGVRVQPTVDGREVGQIKEFPLPPKLYQQGRIVLTFDRPAEPGVNWRHTSRLSEVWLKQSE